MGRETTVLGSAREIEAQREAAKRVKVLYISGFGRSGSTVLGGVLGQIEGFFHGGELRHIWDRGLVENWLCGCGSPFGECDFWNRVFQDAFEEVEHVDAPEMIRLREASCRTHHVPLMLTGAGLRVLSARAGSYMENLERLYRTIQRQAGSRLIVDSSKYPSYGYLLSTIPGIDLYVVHLVRDPRAVTYSWRRKRVQTGAGGGQSSPSYMRQYNPLGSALRWGVRNVATEMLWKRSTDRCLTLRYEDFVARPQETLKAVLNMVGEDEASLPFVSARGVEMDVGHTISGNPSRFRTGAVELRPDDEWRTSIRKGDRRMVTALTLPLLSRYGYEA